ncbi:PqqD family protein [Rhodohalobacter sp. 614A]|uniref:PqqD family protein n=1 Tax=Rhodohalobacter sp. 614A TaxID=2908649 RepID=UPI001F416B4E|nr:PqqD family protein [Rhodohalobacter sp. 614A]
MTRDTKIVRTNRALVSSIKDELVMFDVNAGQYYGLNNVATAVWNNLETEKTVDELCQSLTQEFDISLDECREEMLAFLPELEEKGLIEVVG